MADEKIPVNAGEYGYEDDNQEKFNLPFGLTSGVTRMVKFEYNPNGGKDGAEQEALDVVFNINGTDISYRKFPVTKAYSKDGKTEITDPRAPEFIQARKDFNAIIVHILGVFVDKEQIKAAFSVPITSFKQFCEVAKKLLPAGYENVTLDVFANWQWTISGDNDRTYCRLPSKMKHGKWLCKHEPPISGEWNEIHLNGGLSYVSVIRDNDGKVIQTQEHPFKRNKWFMDSNFAKQQIEEKTDVISEAQGESAPQWGG